VPRKPAVRSIPKASKPAVVPPAPATEPAPDPEGVAQAILGEGGGKEAPGASTERVRRYRARKRQEEAPEPPATPAPQLDGSDTAGMVRVVWELAAVPIAGRWPDGTPKLRLLNDEQAARMGNAFAPLVNKWLLLLGPWQLEIAALFVTLGVIRECATPRPLEPFDLEDTSHAPVDSASDSPA